MMLRNLPQEQYSYVTQDTLQGFTHKSAISGGSATGNQKWLKSFLPQLKVRQAGWTGESYDSFDKAVVKIVIRVIRLRTAKAAVTTVP